MRVFVALCPPDDLRGSIAGAFRTDRESWKPAPGKSLHLTLLFYGDLGGKDLEELCQSVGTMCRRTEEWEIGFSGLVFFPSARNPRVCALDIDRGREALRGFSEGLRNLAPAGFDAKPFSPHLTLARARDHRAHRSSCVFDASARFSFRAKSCIVYESVPGERGYGHIPRYESKFGNQGS